MDSECAEFTTSSEIKCAHLMPVCKTSYLNIPKAHQTAVTLCGMWWLCFSPKPPALSLNICALATFSGSDKGSVVEGRSNHRISFHNPIVEFCGFSFWLFRFWGDCRKMIGLSQKNWWTLNAETPMSTSLHSWHDITVSSLPVLQSLAVLLRFRRQKVNSIDLKSKTYVSWIHKK